MRLIRYKNAVYRAVAETMELQVLQLRPGQKFDPAFKAQCVGPWSTNIMNNKPLCSSGKQPLWTSSYDYNEKGSAWLNYCKRTWENAIGEQAVIFEVAPTASILRAFDDEDYETIWELYPNTEQKPFAHGLGVQKLLDYNAIAREYDGFHVMPQAISAYELREWSVESTVWFNPAVLKLHKIVDIEAYCGMAWHNKPLSTQEKVKIKEEKEKAKERFLDEVAEHTEKQRQDPSYKGKFPRDKTKNYELVYQIPRP